MALTKVDGQLMGVPAAVSGALYTGSLATSPLGGATNPTIGAIETANNYIQAYAYNVANGTFSSADMVVYPNNGQDASGWVDVGITSNNYSQAAYSITGRNEGYLFMSAPTGSGTSGNLVYATDSTGNYNSHQWYAGGFNKPKANVSMTLDTNSNLGIAGSVNAVNSYGYKNKLINGAFNIWQRGTTVSNWGSFGYTADNTQIGYDGSPPSGRTLTRQTFTPGQTDVDGDPTYYAEYTFPSCGTPTNYLRFPVEGVRTLAGKKATFSFWAKVPSGTMTIGVAICQEFGTGGSPSAGVYPTATNYTVTTTWQKFVYTTTLGSIAGKTIGTNNNDMMWPAIWCPTNAIGTIQLANLQLEEGTMATAFDKRPYATDLALCQRYLPSFSAEQGTLLGMAGTATLVSATVQLCVPPRVVPNGVYVIGSWYTNTNATQDAATVTFTGYGGGFYASFSIGTSRFSGNQCVLLNGAAGAKLLFTGCEL